jgi:hypothetical protein
MGSPLSSSLENDSRDPADAFHRKLKAGSEKHAALDRIPAGTMGGAYFELWLAELRSIDPALLRGDAGLEEEIKGLTEAYRDRTLTWTGLNGLVRRSLSHLEIERVDAIRCFTRTYFYQRARSAYAADYDRSSPPALNVLATAPRDPATGKPAAALETSIRADAVRLHDEVTRIEIYRPYQEEKRTEITWRLSLWTTFTVGVLFLIAGLVCLGGAFRLWPYFFPVVPLVMVFGALGAAVSALRRLQDSFDADASILNITKYLRVPIGIRMAPLVGAIFALILLLVLIGDILPPNLLPDLDPPESGQPPPAPTPLEGIPRTFGEWAVLCTGPASPVEYAKLLVFSFLAGFAERLVPDTLDRLVGKPQSPS